MRYKTAMLATCLLVHCGPQPPHSADLSDSRIPTPALPGKAVLGKGYDTLEERFTGECVTGTTQYVGTAEGILNFDRSLSQEETAKSLGFGIGGRARYGVVEASASARFASSSTSSAYSEATVYSAEYKYKNAKLNYTGLTEVGEKAMAGGDGYAFENWKKTCGHEYVEQIELGAKLYISAKVDFATKEDKQSFAAEFKIKGPAFSASGNLKRASRKFGRTASVSIQAYQLGGDVSRLSAIFSGTGDAEREGDRVHALLVCSMDNMDACLRILDRALRYATDVNDPVAFPNQIRPDYSPGQPDGPAELAYITKPWTDLAIYPPPPIIAASIREARKELSAMFEENLQLRERVRALLFGSFRLSTRQRDLVANAQAVLANNMSAIHEGAVTCYSDIMRCPAKVEEVRDRLRRVDENHLVIALEVFAQWCDAYQAGKITTRAKPTMAALLSKAEEDLVLEGVADYCGAVGASLEQRTKLMLSNRDLVSLAPLVPLAKLQELSLASNPSIADYEPLKELQYLTKLSVANNRLSRVDFLADLAGLRRINVSGNKLRSLGTIARMTQLEELNAGDNQIRNVTSLQSMSNLRKLVMNNNGLEDIQPLTLLSNLEYLDLSFNEIGDFKKLIGLSRLHYLDVNDNPGSCPESLWDVCVIPF